MTREGRGSGPQVCAAVSAVVAGGWFLWQSAYRAPGRRRFTLFDDATISLTYARTFAHGHGLVWYPGAPRVEGFTNPLWTIVMSVPFRLGVSSADAPLAVGLIALAAVVGCAVCSSRLAEQLGADDRYAPWAAGIGVAVCYPLLFWSLRGMEVGLLTLLLLVAVSSALAIRARDRISDQVLLVVCIVAGIAVRLDFAVVGAAIAGWAIAARVGHRERRTSILAVAATILGVGVVLALQRWYYGQYLPNTYYLKVAGIPMSWRLTRGSVMATHLLIGSVAILVAAALVATMTSSTERRAVALLWTCVLALAVYAVIVGGDAWEWMNMADRYLTPAIVLMTVIASRAIAPVVRWLRQRSDVRSAALVAVVGVWLVVSAFVADHLPYDLTWLQLPRRTPWMGVGPLLLVGLVAMCIGLVVRLRVRHDTEKQVLSVALVVGLALLSTGHWHNYLAATAGPPVAYMDGVATDYGTALHRVTRPGARIAMVWAGTLQYNSDRTGVDLLGKSDPVVARSRPHLAKALPPGHARWDLAHSVVQLHPDVVAQLWGGMSPTSIAWVERHGYQPMVTKSAVRTGSPFVMLVRTGTPNVVWQQLEPVTGPLFRPTFPFWSTSQSLHAP